MNNWIVRIIRSKVMWLNFIGAATIALEASIGLLQPFIAGNVYAWVSVALAVGNAALRTITSQPLSQK